MRKKLSVTGILIVIITSLAMLTACSSPSSPSGSASDSAASGSATAELSGTVKTGGSTSVEKVMNALIYQFQDENRSVTIDYEMNGSGDGIKNTISGLYEIGHSSRELKTDGTEDGLTATAYAIDGIAVIVSLDNKIASLTKDQLQKIYSGKITNWSEVGGSDALITVVSREAGSGTRSAFAEIIGLEKANDESTSIVANATVTDSTGGVQTTVAQNPNAIGYMSFSDVDTSKVNTVAYEGVKISVDTLKDSSYKLKREFYLLTKAGATLSATAQGFVDFVLSDAGQQIVKSQKLLPIK